MIGRTISHYRILEKLGSGGMGEVYLAQDSVLERKVAVKFILEPDSRNPQLRLRLQREAKAAAAMDHPYICKVYETGTVEERAFIAMEYVSGQTLAQRLAAGPLSVREALQISLEVAEALGEAHRQNIIHRDLKPSNIMLTRQGHIKIMDFGLARQLVWMDSSTEPGATVSEVLTAPGKAVGTPAYMSPEQLRGQDIDTRSDLFSFGIVLYEMLSGKHPFAKAYAVDTAGAILNEEPPPLGRFVKDIPPALDHIVRKLLARKPEARSASAAEVLVDLRMIQRESGPTPAAHPSSRRHRGVWILGFVAALLAIIAWAVSWSRVGRVDAMVPAGSALLITDFENRTGDHQLDHIRTLLENQLRQSAYINLTDSSDLRETLRQMIRPPDQVLDPATAREVAWRRGIALIVNGELSQIGSTYLLNLSLERVGSRPTEPAGSWSQTFRADGKEKILKSVDSGSDWVRKMVGEAARDVEQRDLPSSETTTSSWEALDLFSKAEKLKHQDKAEDALVLLKEAVRIDSQFALSYMRMGDILFSLRRQREGFYYWQRSLDALGQGRLTKREEMRIKSLFAFDTGQYLEAEKLFRAFALLYSNDYYPRFYHGLTLKEAGREPEAIQEFIEAEKRAPNAYYMPVHLAMTWMILDHYDEALKSIQRLRELNQTHWAAFMEGSLFFLQGNSVEAKRIFAGLIESRDDSWRSRGYSLQAAILGEEGKYREALRALKEGTLFDSSKNLAVEQADKLIAAGYIYKRLNERAAVRSACLEAVRLDRSPMRMQAAGALLAQSGFIDEGRGLEAELDSEAPIFAVARHRIRGEAYLARRRVDLALREFEQASRLEPPTACREYLARAKELAADGKGSLSTYRGLINSRARLWHYAETNAPGIWADALYQYIKIAWSLNQRAGLDQNIQSYLKLRDTADPELPEVSEVRRLLHQLTQNQNHTATR